MVGGKIQADDVIGDVVNQIAVEPVVLAVLLAGSYATGRAWPSSDVDLLVTVEDGPIRFRPMLIEANDRGRMRRLEGEPNAHVAVDCDPERLRRILLEII